jgi:site-specific recombinase XerD
MSDAKKDLLSSKLPVLTPEEVEKCLLQLTDTQHRAIFSLIVELGMTPIEILGDPSIGMKGIYIQDIDSKKQELKVRYRFKNDNRINIRIVPMTPSSIISLKDFLSSKRLNFHDTGKIFDLSDRMVRHFLATLEEKVDIEKPIDTTTLRRTAIVNMLRSGLKPDEIKNRLGFVRPQEEAILIISAYFLPDLDDYERVFKDFMFENISAISRTVQLSKN